ncbi:MAG: kynureninase [Aestuariivita sp.]|nr:kynureninase [Aestuariivita sp.]
MTDFSATKAMFQLPENIIYLDGNSLGPLPQATSNRMTEMLTNEWGEMLITGWNNAGWMQQPSKLGDRIGKLIGAKQGCVVTGDTLSIKVFQALSSALELRPNRSIILTDSGNFPSDIYIAEGLIRMQGNNHQLQIVSPENVINHISSEVAVIMLTEIDYRTGRKHDMAKITEKAHQVGALTLWDLAHSAGAIPVNLTGCMTDFAVGCTYKYLNAGPGAPAFIYVAEQHINNIHPVLSGWLGHSTPFDFELHYRPKMGIDRMRVGTPSVIQLTALDAALNIWDHVNINDVRAKSIELAEQFISGVESQCPELTLCSPRAPELRGSHVSFHFEDGYAVIQALIARGVIGDFRAPDIIRFGITPLYIDQEDIDNAIDIIRDVMSRRLWDHDEYRQRAAVT